MGTRLDGLCRLVSVVVSYASVWILLLSYSPFHRQSIIMLGGGFKADRLRVNLRLVMNRLKLLEKKKSKSWTEYKHWSCSPTDDVESVCVFFSVPPSNDSLPFPTPIHKF